MAELKPYHPSLRDRLAQMLMGDEKPSAERRRFVEGLTGGNGLGMRGPGIADFLPGGQIMALDEAMRDSDPQAAAMAIMPIPGAARAGAASKVGRLSTKLNEPARMQAAISLNGKVYTGTNHGEAGLKAMAENGIDDVEGLFAQPGFQDNLFQTPDGKVISRQEATALVEGQGMPRSRDGDLIAEELNGRWDLENAQRPNAPFPHLAERYPETAPPVIKEKEKKPGEFYEAKNRSAEENALMKERLLVQKDMDANGYEPYFDPAQRADVDKSQYPTEQNTLRDVVGAKQATRDKHEALASTPEGIARLKAAFERGQQIPGAENWYWMKQLEDEFVQELGPEAGRAAFKDQFAGGMAATTGGMDPMNNLLLSQFGAFQKNKGLPIPEAGHQIPSPMGGPYTYGNLENYYKMQGADGLDMDAMKNPKRHDFQYNFLGHEDKATIDEQMSALLGIKDGAPPSGNYGSYEKPVHDVAAEYGVAPRYAQEVMWAGGKQMKNEAKGKVVSHHEGGKPMIQFVNDAVERTHRLTGMPRKEIVRRALVRGEIPLYGAAGATAGGLYGLDGEPYEPEQF